MTQTRPRKKRLARTKRGRIRSAAEVVFKLFGFLEYLCYPANNTLTTSRYEVASAKLPPAFDGYTIVQVSDLHGKEFGEHNATLLAAVEREKPDLIVVTGDAIDERHFFPDRLRVLFERLVQLAPVVYIVGNHEADLYDEYFAGIVALVQESGAAVMLGQETRIARGRSGDAILLAGVADPKFDEPYEELVSRQLERFSHEPDAFRVLLSHRPEGFSLYVKHGYDLVFSGHAHGGQFRIPGLCPNGLNAPGQGWFPKYTAGTYVQGATTMVVSRGLGPSVIPTRLFNRPELVVCRLRLEG